MSNKETDLYQEGIKILNDKQKENKIMKMSFCCEAQVNIKGNTDFYYECTKCHTRCFVYTKEKK